MPFRVLLQLQKNTAASSGRKALTQWGPWWKLDYGDRPRVSPPIFPLPGDIDSS